MMFWNQLPRALLLMLFSSIVSAEMNLEEVYQLALTSDPLWLGALSEAEAGREIVAQSASQLLPQITLDGTYSRVDLNRNGQADQDYRSRQVTLMLTQPLLNRPARLRYESAQLKLQEIEARLRQKRGELLERVVKSYFSILQAESIIGQLHSLEKSNQTQLYATTRAYELGQGTKTDVDEAQARMDLVMVRLMQAQQQRDLNRKELSFLIGQNVGGVADIDKERLVVKSPVYTLEESLYNAEKTSSLLQQANLGLSIAKKRVAELRSEHLPTLDLFLKKSSSDSETVNTIGSEYDTGQIGVTYRLPLFSGGRTVSKVREAEALLDKQQAYYNQVNNALHLQVNNEYLSVTHGALRITAMHQVVHSAQQQVMSTEKGILAGTRTTVDWLNAQQQLSDAKRQLSTAYYEYLMAVVRLNQLTGKPHAEILGEIMEFLQ